MPSLKDDLTAARALIDSPKKRAATTVYGALRIIAGEEANDRFYAMQAALREQLPARAKAISTFDRPNHQRAVMALFDRAIAAA